MVLNNLFLMKQLVLKDFSDRYHSSIFGLFLSLLNSLVFLGIYTFVFSFVLRVKWPTPGSQREISFPVMLFGGLVVHTFLSEVLTRSVGPIVLQPNCVNKVVFPVEILSPVLVVSSSLQCLLRVSTKSLVKRQRLVVSAVN